MGPRQVRIAGTGQQAVPFRRMSQEWISRAIHQRLSERTGGAQALRAVRRAIVAANDGYGCQPARMVNEWAVQRRYTSLETLGCSAAIWMVAILIAAEHSAL
jgi:hypothetical protein